MKTYLKRIKNALEIPFDPYDERTNREAIISGLLNLVIVVIFLYLTPLILERGFSSPQVFILLTGLLILILLRYGVHKNYGQLASMVLMVVVWGIVMYEFLWFENGLRAPAYTAALAFIISYAGLLHGRRAAWMVACGSILINILVALGELKGVYLVEPQVPDIRWVVLGQIIFFAAITYILNKTLQNFRKSIQLYRTESKNRLKAELDVRQLNQELETAYETTLEGWAQALELRDKETEGHSRRVTKLSVELASELGFIDDETKYIYYGAILHDIGKMGIPDGILNKPGPLTPDEWIIVRQHPVFAYEMLKHIDYLQPALSIPYAHHENWDGSGYPRGLKGEDIPLPARIFAVVDNWDALTSDRPYRKAWSQDETIQYIQEQSGKKFDPRVVDVFLAKIVADRK